MDFSSPAPGAPRGAIFQHYRVVRMALHLMNDPDMVTDAQRTVANHIERWATDGGYELLSCSWEVTREDELSGRSVTDPFLATGEIRAIVSAQARWDGVWGDLRRALAEDGLLPHLDGPEPAAARFPPRAATVWTGTYPPIDPYPGDMWMDPATGIARVYTADRSWMVIAPPITPSSSPASSPS